ncbi:MAG: extracellular solute-binding protein family 1 [Defluviitaleaceae bacterium]|nr:extracellular solute-binding protein family 1 [Defluviitaleaceae bacterium]
MKDNPIIKLLFFLGITLIVLLLNIYSDFIWGDASDNKNKKEVIRVWTIHGNTEEALERVLKKYEEKNPNITFEITVYKNEVYQAAINNALFTGNLPDMFFWWGFSKLERLVDADVAYDLSLAVKNRQIQSEVIDGGMNAFTFNNKIYGLPLYGWTATMFCNRQIFSENKLKYPEDYDQFIETINHLQEKNYDPLVTSALEGWVPSLYYMGLVQGEGTGKSIFDAVKDHSLFSTPQFGNSASKLYHLVELGAWQDNYLECDGYNAVYYFAQGKGAMLYYGSWATTFLEGELSKVSDQVDVIPFPNGNNKEGIGGFVDTFVINKKGLIAKDEELVNMYIDIMREVSDIIVCEVGSGIPVYCNQSIDQERFPLLYKIWEMNKDRTLYHAYDQIMSEELTEKYYLLLKEMMAGEINDEEFIKNMSVD